MLSSLPIVDSSALLTQLLDRLLAQHRAGLNPTFGQIEDLVELNTRVKEDLLHAGYVLNRTDHVAQMKAALERVRDAVSSVHELDGTGSAVRVPRESFRERSAK